MIKGEKLARPIVKSVLRRLFGNQAWPLISHLLQVGNLLLEDLQYLESQISPQLEKQEQKGEKQGKGDREMIPWVPVILSLSLAAILSCFANPSAPHRLRFFVCLVAMFAWLLPWQLLQDLFVMPADVLPALLQVNLPALRPVAISEADTATISFASMAASSWRCWFWQLC